MKAVVEELKFSTNGEIDLIDITYAIEEIVERSGVKNGQVLVFVPGATGAIVTIEHERGLLEDFKRLLKELVPKGAGYKHDLIDNNAHSHLRASLLGPSLVLPVVEGRVIRGTWQQIFFVELDVRPRRRKVIVQVIGS
ncbi:secondary thiamine-phosphate synthase enzyme YjbQ [Thermococcus argininiproducens]|uniref:Secondary thiamine-phosphate synthase enzyme YjbQ n=1 Tax=Thermococcus argininiproducens TaxID=2866384 RepID=A0A9E7SCZ7_9EURY|nr:secondary thiamine-phosphate synthase enzyme YjbQ [Thermococcus argininiproducens]USH00624.1 secondary thiamine-phosphate synthase enzyme YjbQ [Thermococcus argininiproducens]